MPLDIEELYNNPQTRQILQKALGNNSSSFSVGLNSNNLSGNLIGSPNIGANNFNAGSNSIFGADGFGFNKGTFGAVGQGIGALSDLAGIYFGKQQLDLAEDQYNTNKAFGNRNIANQAQAANNTIEARYRAALAAKGHGVEGGGNKESLQSYLDRSRVDGSAIG